MSRDYRRTTRICGYLHRLIPGYPGIIPGCPGISQTWDSRICGYLHKRIPGCPGIIPGQLGSVATSTGLSQDIPGLFQDVPGYLRTGTLGSVATSTHLSQDVLGYPGTTQTWDSRICGYLHRLIPGYPGIIPGYLRPGTLGSVATSTSLCQDIPRLS